MYDGRRKTGQENGLKERLRLLFSYFKSSFSELNLEAG